MKRKYLFLIALLFSLTMPVEAQINFKRLGKQIRRSVEGQVEQKIKEKSARETRKALDKAEKKLDEVAQDAVSGTAKSKPGASSGRKSGGIANKKSGSNEIYVSAMRGSNRNNGSVEAPFKDLQKAVDEAPEGAVIMVAEGNYQGKLGVGYIEINKYLSIVGGFSDDFAEWDPLRFQTMIRPGAGASGTGGNHGLLDIYVKGKRKGVVLIDGLILDKGEMNCYFLSDSSNPKSGTPEGCETGRLDPPGFMSSGAPKMEDKRTVSNQLIHGDVEGQVTIRNCVLLNGSHYGIQMGNMGGHFDIYNNLFLANRMAACEVRGMIRDPGEATVDFYNNTVMFVWRRDPMPGGKDMGYGFRYMTRVDANVYNNIFGCIDFAALDRTYIDSDKRIEALRKTSAWDNLFFGNIEADIALPSGGGKFLRVFAEHFEDVDQLIKYEGNHEVTEVEAAQLIENIEPAYLKGFLSMDGNSSMTHNPNSSENILRSVLGMNQRGTSSYTVSMYMNRYPLDKAGKLFGAVRGYGAQIPE